MLIREAQKVDYPSICNLFRSKDELFLVYPVAHFPLTISDIEQLASRRLALTVIEVEKSIAGFANLYDLSPGKSAFIGNVIIEHTQRGKGFAKQLIKHMLMTAINVFKLPEVCVSVFSENTPAILLYHSFGFVPYALETRTDPEGQQVALIHMALNSHDFKI